VIWRLKFVAGNGEGNWHPYKIKRTMKNYIPLCSALVDALLVFESSAPNEVDPDVAVRAMENMSSSLLKLDVDDQRELRRAFGRIADEATDRSYKTFVHSVPAMLGLAE
jgi:hypothetical protein